MHIDCHRAAQHRIIQHACPQEEATGGYGELGNAEDAFGISACTASSLPTGEYVLAAVLGDGNTVYSAASVQSKFAISSVSPAVGSAAGGTLLKVSGVSSGTSETLFKPLEVSQK
jgi:hypothetical protein